MPLALKARRAIAKLGLVICLILATTISVAAPANAATCSGASCAGQDPNATGCSSGAYTTRSQTLTNNATGAAIGTFEIRYSPTCGTNWARITMYGGTIVYMFLQIQRSPGPYPAYSESGYYSAAWTNMAYAPTPALACANGYGGNSQWVGSAGNFCS